MQQLRLDLENTHRVFVEREVIQIYCDGACMGNPGPGGWGAVLLHSGDIESISGGEKCTTNNRMELTAAISALLHIKERAYGAIEIFSDSTYLVKGMTLWLRSWKQKRWNNGKVKNIDLWQQLDMATTRLTASNTPVKWSWVRGHSGHTYNEMADKLAKTAALKEA